MMRFRRTVLALFFVLAPVVAYAQWPHLAGQPLRSGPIHVDADGSVFVVNPDSDTVTHLSALSGGVQTVLWEAPVGDYPRTLTLWGDHVLTANQDDDTVTRLAKSDGGRVQDVSLGFGCAPYGISGNHAGDRLYVSCQGTQELVVLGADLGVVARIALDWPQPRALAVSADDTRVYASHFLTVEPNDDAHVSEIDAAANALTARRALAVPADRQTCETQNSGQGVTNLVNTIALTPPDSPAGSQLWVGGTLQNNLTKGLFRRWAGFRDADGKLDPRLGLFDLPCPDEDASVSCRFRSFPRGETLEGIKRNVYKSSFHDITRFVIWKIDLASGAVVGKIDVDEANHATDLVFSRDGRIAYVVDQMFHSFHVFNTRRGQDGNPATLFASVAKAGRFGANPADPCDGDALGSTTGEGPFLNGFEPQAQITPIGGGDPVRLDGSDVAQKVNTGLDFDTREYHVNGNARMRPVPDAIGTAPIGVTLSADGCIAYVANYLGRNVVAVSAQPGVPSCTTPGQKVDFRCSRNITLPCRTVVDCPRAGGVCGHPGGATCSRNEDCAPGTGPCIRDDECVPLLIADPVTTTSADPLAPEILDGKILFNTAARDASVPNGVGLGNPAPLFNAIQKHCSNDGSITCTTDDQCVGGTCIVTTLPGEVVSVAHDASYVTCTACHSDYGGQDGRTWDFSQFGASLRNTMDLRGRSQAAPGTCDPLLSADLGKAGTACHFDAECGSGSAPSACHYDPNDDDKFPPHLSADDRHRFFNPMMTVHWNGDRMEVEGFEFTYRSLLGAGDCDGEEHNPNKCLGALVPRSLLISTATIGGDGVFEGDLRSTLRNIMVDEPTLGKPVNASIRLTHMADFVYSLTRFPRNPFLGDGDAAISDAAERGRRIFNDPAIQCASCHNGPSNAQLFTDKRPNAGFVAAQRPGAASNNPFVRHAVGTANLFDQTDPNAIAEQSNFQNSAAPIPASRTALLDYVTPVLNDAWNTAPYLHDGTAATLLDVVRPCQSVRNDCNAPGSGRNVDGAHGVTAFLTPQQLNDLVAYQKAPHNPVGAPEGALIRSGALSLDALQVKYGKRAGKGSFRVAAKVMPGVQTLGDGDVSLTLAIPDGELMALHGIAAPATEVKRRRSGLSFKADGASVKLRRLRNGDYRLSAKGKRADLSALDTGAHDVTVALVVGDVQFAESRRLTATKRGRVLVLRKRGK
jgi:DNA-binding beta-propeller fold protein YncE